MGSPFFLIVMILIKLDGLLKSKNRGPVFFSEQRVSQGVIFDFYKFRTFKVSAIKSMMSQRGTIITKSLESQPANMTRVGNLLKKFYLDELPQLWNVFIGDMSMVGTRPWNLSEYKQELKQGNYRKKIGKAGLIGLVQIKKGQWASCGGQHELDEVYFKLCKEKSQVQLLLIDIKIILQSLWVVLKGKGL
jgi:lipopolysaccharide/colanic/teichoic acid biosynthesis glycosyltransferase